MEDEAGVVVITMENEDNGQGWNTDEDDVGSSCSSSTPGYKRGNHDSPLSAILQQIWQDAAQFQMNSRRRHSLQLLSDAKIEHMPVGEQN